MLLERDAALATLAAALDEAVGGRGRLVFIGGEAGVGKTTLVREAARRAAATVRVRLGMADNVTTAAALGALVDAVPEVSGLLEATPDAKRLDLFRQIRDVLASAPTVLVLEDVNWADQATLDLIRYLARRLDELPLLVVATYRSEEVSARDPISVLLADLATASAVTRIAVDPLSASGVAALVAEAGSAIDPIALHVRTGGNAFYATEVLAAAGEDLPPSVRDAVVGRAARLSAPARSVLAAAAVVGQPADAGLLLEAAAALPTALDKCVQSGLLVRDRGGWAFRHELARLAIEGSLDPSELLTAHRRVLAVLLERGSDDDRRLAYHAAATGDRVAAHRHSLRAAERAGRLGAHREAAEQYRTALRFDDGTSRVELLEALSYECYLTNDLEESLSARLRAMELAEAAGDVETLGRSQRWVSRLVWFLGRGADSERYAARAIATLEPRGDSHELAMAYSNSAQLSMLAGNVDETRRWAALALDLADRTADVEAEIHALNNLGTAEISAEDSAGGKELLQRSLDLALREDAQEHAARAFTNLGSMEVVSRDLADAEHHLRAGIAYSVDRDLDSWALYMSANLSRALAEQGRYDEAGEYASGVLRHPHLPPVTAVVALLVAAQLAMRRGEDSEELLTHAWQLAVDIEEAQRVVPAAAARAEAAWLTDNLSSSTEALDFAWSLTTSRALDWEAGELAYWRAIAGLDAVPTGPVPEPFALMLQHRWGEAAEAWRQRNCPLWQALALSREPELEAAREALEIVDRLGAPAVREAILRTRYAAELPVPRGPRASSRGNPAALTSRELEVLGLLAEGLSNGDIARRLFLSEKTVGHHVSAVLRKLAEPTRARAVAAAVRSGVIATPSASDTEAPS